jgi:hypothetical protein
VPFIKPRSGNRRDDVLLRKEGVDGIASILVSHVIDGPDDAVPPEDKSKLEDRSMRKASIVHNGSSIEHNSDYTMDSTKESVATKSTTKKSMDLPFDAHLLSGCGQHFYAVLPVICVADPDNIIPLLASVLYQRRVWNINEPAVGIVCSNTGTSCRVILGWLDQDSSCEDKMVNLTLISVIGCADSRLFKADCTRCIRRWT